MPIPTEKFVRILSPLGEQLLFHRMEGEEALGQPFRYDLTLLSKSSDLVLSDFLGKVVTVELNLQDTNAAPNDRVRFFNGYITRFSHLGAHRNYHLYSATVRPWIWLLSQPTNCRIFQNKTVPEIIKTVFRSHGLTDLKECLTGEYQNHEFITQYRETDLNFVSRLMEDEGIYYFFTHHADKHTLVLADSYGAHTKVNGYQEVPYIRPGSMQSVLPDHFVGWENARQILPGTVVMKDFNFQNPKANLLVTRSEPNPHPMAEFEHYDFPGDYLERSSGETYARLRMEEINARHEQAKGTGNPRGLTTGSLFKLTGYPIEAQNREYLVTGARFSIEGPDYESNEGSGDMEPFHCALDVIQSHCPYRPESITPRALIPGPQTATVVGKVGEEIWTDEFGRVKVQFHWDREGKRDENSSCWIRVAQMWAGNNWGAMHIPRIGQEVIVDFLEGNPDQPIITGRVYNADNMPPYKLRENKTQSGIKSRSTPQGTPDNFNEIRFEDKKDKEELHMQAERDMSTLVKRNQSLSVGANRDISVGGDETTTINKIRRLHVVEDEFINIDGNHTNTVCKDVVETFMQNQDIDITQDKTEHVKQIYTLTTDQKFSLNQAATNLTFEGTNVTLDAAGTVLVKRGPAELLMDGAGKIKLSTPASITLECGPSKIEMTPAGIKLTSVQVIAEATPSKLELGPVAASLSGAMVKVEAKTICSVMGMATLKLNTP